MKHVLSYSGGKDSTAMYLLAVERGIDFLPVFADTGNEHEITCEFVTSPLYRMGCGRVGCMPCIHSRKDEIRNIAFRFPEHVERIAEWERLVSGASKRGCSTFFSANKTPGRHTRDSSLPMPKVHDVVKWSRTRRGGRQFDLTLLLDPPQCSSLYGLCE